MLPVFLFLSLPSTPFSLPLPLVFSFFQSFLLNPQIGELKGMSWVEGGVIIITR